MQALSDVLKATHRGYFIPPRPEKNTVEGQRASTDFLELRRSALERYLQQLATHPVISTSQVRLTMSVIKCSDVCTDLVSMMMMGGCEHHERAPGTCRAMLMSLVAWLAAQAIMATWHGHLQGQMTLALIANDPVTTGQISCMCWRHVSVQQELCRPCQKQSRSCWTGSLQALLLAVSAECAIQ